MLLKNRSEVNGRMLDIYKMLPVFTNVLQKCMRDKSKLADFLPGLVENAMIIYKTKCSFLNCHLFHISLYLVLA